MPPAQPKPDTADRIVATLSDAKAKGPLSRVQAAQLVRAILLEVLAPSPTPKSSKRSPFGSRTTIPPLPDQVTAYSLSRDRNAIIDGEAFCDFYASKGWCVGKQKMKDWQAAVRTWQRSSRPGPHGPGSEPFRKDYTKL